MVVVDGEQPRPAPVASKAPQGSVLGPCIFLFFINDMAKKLQSTVRQFVDDTIVYLAIASQCDAMAPQHDLNTLAKWEQTWQMEFHPNKCQVLWVTNKQPQNITSHDYILHGHMLSFVDDVKFLGLTVLSNFKWTHKLQRTQPRLTPPGQYWEGMSRCPPKPSSLPHAQPLYNTICEVLQCCLGPLHKETDSMCKDGPAASSSLGMW